MAARRGSAGGGARRFGGQQELRQPAVQHPPPDVGDPELLHVAQRHRGEPDAADAPAGAETGGHAGGAMAAAPADVDAPPAADALLAAAAPVSPVPKGRVDVVRILTVGNRLAASRSSSRAFPSRPTSSRTTVRPCRTPEKRLGPRQKLAGRRRRAVEEVARSPPHARQPPARPGSRPRHLVFPAPRTPTTETTDCRSQASAIRFCQNLRDTTRT